MTDRAEAARRESAFLGNLAGAQDEYDWLIENEAWTDLGWDSFGDWWEGRVRPVMLSLSVAEVRDAGIWAVQYAGQPAFLIGGREQAETAMRELVAS